MTHPMSQAWLDWQSIDKEPRDFELILYVDKNRFVWAGNHPPGCHRGVWGQSGGGGATGTEPVAWARIPFPHWL